MALVERQGHVQSFHLRVANITAATVKPIIAEVLSTDSHFRTDESGIYWKAGEEFASHRTVNHAAKSMSAATPTPTRWRVISQS
jgi:hypothetical protein